MIETKGQLFIVNDYSDMNTLHVRVLFLKETPATLGLSTYYRNVII